jgi:hypothetical protein
MITNFEKYTPEIKESHIAVCYWLDDYFAGKTTHEVPTPDKPITAKQIKELVRANFTLKGFAETNVRTCINHLRKTGTVPVLSNQRGYFVSYEKKEIETVIISLLQRTQGIHNAIKGLERFL